jgi:uncharacterized delta-60 repeat protein
MNANYKSIVLAIGLLFALSDSTSAAPGDLDPTFGSGGIVITNGGASLQLYTALAMAIQSDGKIVVVGEGASPPFDTYNWDFTVVRYNPDGSQDSSFGGTGIVITPVGANFDRATSVGIQSDGKIVVAGSSGPNFALVRYNTDGSLDTSFNGTGKVITSVGSSGGADSVAIQADGKIVVAGRSWDGSTSSFALVRYTADGSLDTAFNGTGKVVTPGGSAASVAIQSDAKIIAAGSSGNGSNIAFTLVRYNADGTLDTSFNGTGKAITSVGNSGSGASDLAIQTDGKIVAAGYSFTASDNWTTADFALVRYNLDGSLDTSFGGTGKILIPDSDSGDHASSVAIQPNGKVVVAGSRAIINRSYDFVVARLNPNGSLDTSFNGTGKVITSVGDAYDHVGSVAIQADGKIVVAGDTGPDEFKDFVVVRYQGDDTTPAACPNPIDCANFFVRQHYLDFLNREPDDAGLTFWTNEITFCGTDAQCVEAKRVNVSAAFFLSIEFQHTGYLAYRAHKAAFGNLAGKPVPITRAEMLRDMQTLASGVVVNADGWQVTLEQNKQTYFAQLVASARFSALYPQSMTPEHYVDALNANAGGALSPAERNTLVAELSGGAKTRAQALRVVAEDEDFLRAEFNRAFVLMQYFGYLRRNPDDPPDSHFAGYNFWLAKLDQFQGNYIEAEMVKSFISSIEYRQRFAQP